MVASLVVAALAALSTVALAAAPGSPLAARSPAGASAVPGVVPPSQAPLMVNTTVHVGPEPEFATFDPSNGFVYVPNWGSSNVSVLDGTSIVATINVGSIPFSSLYDPANSLVYIVNEGSGTLTVISGVVATANITVGLDPQLASYDAANHLIYVSNTGSANVSVINGTTNTVVTSIHVGTDPSRPLVVTPSGGGGGGGGWLPAASVTPAATPQTYIFIPNTGSNNVSVINGSTNAIAASVNVGTSPQFAAWDPHNVWEYVPNTGSDNVSILADVPPFPVLQSLSVGSSPWSATFDSSNNHVYVPNEGSGTVSVISGTLTIPDSVATTVTVGTAPQFATVDPASAGLVVPNTGSGNVSILSATALSQTLSAGSYPVFTTYDSTNGLTYVQNFVSGTITVLSAAPAPPATNTLTINAVGLPPGTLWSATAGSPPETENNTTVSGHGSLDFAEPAGAITFAIPNVTVGATTYGVAKITGTGNPNLTSATLPNASATWTVHFGALESIFFNESALPQFQLYSGAVWKVFLNASLPHGGPAAQQGSTNATTIQFTAPAGASYKFAVVGPGLEYKVLPPKGGVHVPTHAFAKTEKFKLLTSVVVFKETGLASTGRNWSVSLTGTLSGDAHAPAFSLTLTTTGGAIKFKLAAGTYNYTVANLGTGGSPTPASGSFSVVVPSTATTITITF